MGSQEPFIWCPPLIWGVPIGGPVPIFKIEAVVHIGVQPRPTTVLGGLYKDPGQSETTHLVSTTNLGGPNGVSGTEKFENFKILKIKIMFKIYDFYGHHLLFRVNPKP